MTRTPGWMLLCAFGLAALGAGPKAPPEPPEATPQEAPASKAKDEGKADGEEALPATVDAAVRQVLAGMSDEDRAKVRDTPKKDLIRFHFGWGTSLRNRLGMWGGRNEALLEDCARRKGVPRVHPDDCSMQVIEGVWAALQPAPDAH